MEIHIKKDEGREGVSLSCEEKETWN